MPVSRRLVIVTTTEEYLVPEGGEATMDERLDRMFRCEPFDAGLLERSRYRIGGSARLKGIEVTDRSVEF